MSVATTVAGVDLASEATRLRGLPVFAGGELASRAPTVRVRRARRRPNRLGFAVLDEWRISITAYPGIAPADAKETLLHELVHLHVGTERGRRRWHGRAFKRTLRRAMFEAYGVEGVDPTNALHGAYAAAIAAIEAHASARAARGEQLSLPLAS